MTKLQESEILLTIAALIVGIFILDVATPLGVVIPMLYLIPLWLTLWTSSKHAPFLVAATCTLLTFLGYFLSLSGPGQSAFVNRSLVLATLALNALLVRQEKQTRGALMHEVEERVRAEAELNTLASTLEQRVAERITELKASRAAALNIMEDALEARKKSERAEEEVRQINQKLAAVNAELESFSHSVSHDLRAPLRAMQGFAQALLEDYANRLDSVAQDYAQRIVEATRRMDTLTQDLLAYSRLSNVDMHLRPVHLSSIMAEAQAQLKEDLQERKARLTVEEPLPLVVGHPATLVQVVVNLLANAAKFVAPGVQPQVRVWAEECGKRTRLWVEDNGIGIESEHQARIFRVFEQLHGIETYPGTGIGLAIVRKGTQRMGGLVGVQSEPGRGSRFWIELPKAEQTYEHADAHHFADRG